MLKKLLITDLDNTLYDWVTFFAKSFSAMIDEVVRISKIDREVLLDGFRDVHRRHGNSEYPFAILEVECLREMYNEPTELLAAMDHALHEFNRMRKKTLHLYPTVQETLVALTRRGVRVVGHTEAIGANAHFRLRKLGIVDLFEKLYVLHGAISPHPKGEPAEPSAPPHLIEQVPLAERKPNPRLLLDICRRMNVSAEEAVYVGDSQARDISMAVDAGVTAVWAAYGTKYNKTDWEALVRVTHWTDDDVQREQELRKIAGSVQPDVVINRFADLLGLFPGED